MLSWLISLVSRLMILTPPDDGPGGTGPKPRKGSRETRRREANKIMEVATYGTEHEVFEGSR